jgi:hypothetical protein
MLEADGSFLLERERGATTSSWTIGWFTWVWSFASAAD